MSGLQGPSSEEGCKLGGRPTSQLALLADEFWRYFTRRGVLNSDGRRLLARVAREAARAGCRRLAERIWLVLRDPTVEEVRSLLADYGVDVSRLYAGIQGPSYWRTRSFGGEP